MVSVVHDEIIIDATRSEVRLLVESVPGWMDCKRVSDVVPINVDVEISLGTSWAEKETYREEHSFDDLGLYEGDDAENEDVEEFEPDTATIAFLDQQQAKFVNMEQEFAATYGFEHNCHCGEDYAAGRVGEITQCYH